MGTYEIGTLPMLQCDFQLLQGDATSFHGQLVLLTFMSFHVLLLSVNCFVICETTDKHL